MKSFYLIGNRIIKAMEFFKSSSIPAISLVLFLGLGLGHTSIQAQTTVKSCDSSYTWAANSKAYTTSGIYKDTLVNAGGLDSIVTLNLTINIPSFRTDTANIFGTSYTWPVNNKTYTKCGIHKDTLSNKVGCDSILTLDLKLYYASDTLVTDANFWGPDTFYACVGDFLTFESAYPTPAANDKFVFEFYGARTNPGNVRKMNPTQFNVAGFFQNDYMRISEDCGDSRPDTSYLLIQSVSIAIGSGNVTICDDTSTVLTLSRIMLNDGIGGLNRFDSIVWNLPVTHLSITDSSQRSVRVSPNTTTTYTATVYHALSNSLRTKLLCPATISFTVTVNPDPILSKSTTDVICSADGTATSTVTNANGTYNFTWSNGTVENSVTSSTHTSLAAGTFRVTVAESVTGCSIIDTIVVNNSTSVPVPTVQSLSGTCFGVDSGAVTVTTTA